MQDIGLTGDWELDRKKMKVKKDYCLRVSVYQCRALPSVNDNSLIDPYVKARFCGDKQKTATQRNTQNPIYFETLEFNKQIPADLELAPNLLLQVSRSRSFEYWRFKGLYLYTGGILFNHTLLNHELSM